MSGEAKKSWAYASQTHEAPDCMKALFLWLALALAVGNSAFARGYADATTTAASLQFLKDAKAVAICEIDMFFDGGSLSFTLVAGGGQRRIFVLCAESQRQEIKRPLSLFDNQHIGLVPDSSYDESAVLLREKLTAGLASGLQQKWPAFAEDAAALCQLLKEGGHSKDLDDFYVRATKRSKDAHEAFLRSQEKAQKDKESNSEAPPAR